MERKTQQQNSKMTTDSDILHNNGVGGIHILSNTSSTCNLTCINTMRNDDGTSIHNNMEEELVNDHENENETSPLLLSSIDNEDYAITSTSTGNGNGNDLINEHVLVDKEEQRYNNNNNNNERSSSPLLSSSSSSSSSAWCSSSSLLSLMTTKDEDEGEEEEEGKITYFGVLKSNRPFRLYLLSYVISHAGEWFTYIASIELLEDILQAHHDTNEAAATATAATAATSSSGLDYNTSDISSSSSSSSSPSTVYISYLVVCNLLPNLILFPFGGVLADARDRRTSMIVLDCLQSILPLLFLLGFYYQTESPSFSIMIIYVVTAAKSVLAALYEPCRSAIVPLLAPGEEEMKVATTIAGLAWSVMAALGSAMGGFMVSIVGVRACFVLDSISFLISALILVIMGGQWDASTLNNNNNNNNNTEQNSPLQLLQDMVIGGAKYIQSSKFWPLVFIKVSAAIVYGASDVLNVSFSEENISNNEAESSRRLGALFFCVGFGCLIGPLIANLFTSMKDMSTILNACIISYAVQMLGWLGIRFFDPFPYIAVFTVVRSIGSSVQWINSSLLLQTYSQPDMLGRVLAVDYALALLGESIAAMMSGLLQDKGMSPREVSGILSYIAGLFFLVWSIYGIRSNITKG